jgi:hypothetical protein
VYTMEFEEMWGGSGAQPVPGNAKFGPDKTDNTPHELLIGGKRVESYFSPSDNTNFQIGRTINTADTDLYFALLVFTRFDLALEIEDRVAQFGVYGAGIMDDSTNGSGTSFLILQAVMNQNMLLFDHAGQPGILHHKYLIVDQANPGSDPVVLTGSHNWSSGANQRNDENTLIIHDALLANQYYQEFHNLFNSNGGAVGFDSFPEALSPVVYPNPATGSFSVALFSKSITSTAVSMFSASGQTVWRNAVDLKPGSNLINVPDLELPGGIYFLNVTTDDSIHNLKVVVK